MTLPPRAARPCTAWIAVALLSSTAIAGAGWFREIQVTSEILVEGKQDFTVRLLPIQSHHCEYIEFECVYHQEFPWEDARGQKYTKIHEPVSHLYRREDVKLVNDLDCYISFRVPCGRADLEAKYGPKTFNKEFPVTLSRVKITGYADKKAVWTFSIPNGSKLNSEALEQQAAQTNAVPPVDDEVAPAILPQAPVKRPNNK